MSGPIGSSQWMYNSGGDFYNGAITNSLRFPENSGGGYLSRTFDHANSGEDWTFSTWIKRSQLTSYQPVFASTSTGNPYYQSGIYFNGSDKLYYAHSSNRNSGGNLFNAVTSSAQFRDVSSWYHLVVQRDTDGNTVVYINGTSMGSASSSSTLAYINGTNYPHYIGNYTYQSNPGGVFTGYLAETIFVDGALVAPTVFAEDKEGVWIPLEDPSVTYGQNGFRLQYKQTGTSANSSGIGADTSGNDHHFTVTTLAAHDVVPDNPENNFATLNRLHKGYAATPFSQGDLKVTGTGSAGAATYSTFASTLELKGKVYFEVYVNALTAAGRSNIGIVGENYRMDRYGVFGTIGVDGFDQSGDGAGVGTGDDDWNTAKGGNAATESTIGYTGGGSDTVADAGDVVQIAYDSATGYAWYGVINRDSSDAQAWFNSGNPAGGSGYVGILDTAVKQFAGGQVQSSSDSLIFNFGQDSSFGGAATAQGNTDGNGVGDFYGTVPSGFLALCTANISEPNIGPNSGTQATDHFNTVLYTGDASSTRAITGVGFKPDWVWFAQRNNTSAKVTYDSSRGVNQMLQTNDTTAEDDSSQYGYLSVFGTDGFTAQAGSTNNNYINENNVNIVAWNWKANGGTTTTNDASATSVGTIDSVYQANTTAGFSIVLYTGTGSAGTIAHGLGAVPKWYFTKRRSNTGHWEVYHALNTTAPATEHLRLSTNDATGDDSQYFNDTDPTSTVFSVGDHVNVNASANTYVAYVFAEKEGYSKFGSYIGNGNSDGPMVFCGFKPAWVMIKRTDSANNWHINDVARDTTNPAELYTYADTTGAEDSLSGTGAGLDFLSNGFKTRVSTAAVINASGGKYVFMAFATIPVKYANAR